MTVTSAKTLKEFWVAINFFGNNYKPNSSPITLEQWQQFHPNGLPLMRNLTIEIREVHVSQLDQNFTFEELENSLKRCKLNKSPGKDGILAEYFKNLNNKRKLHLPNIFNIILKREVIPKN